MNEFDSIILGNGVTGNFFNYFLDRKLVSNNQDSDHRVAILSSDVFSGVSSQINIIVSKNGIERKQSALGDLLVSGYEFFVERYSSFDGVLPCPQLFIRNHQSVNDAKFIRRFGDLKNSLDLSLLKEKFFGVSLSSFIVCPKRFISGLQNSTSHEKSYFQCDIISSEFSREGVILSSLDGQKFKAKNLMIASGPYSKLLPPRFFESTHLMRHKEVAGGVWDCKVDLGKSDFILTLGMTNLIYLAKTQQVQLSGASDSCGVEVSIRQRLESIHLAFSDVLDLPEFELGAVIQSLRDKGRSRYPMSKYFVERGCRVMIQCGAYKNGYTTSPYMINDLFNQSGFF